MKIIEEDDKVIIDGEAIEGFVADDVCSKCGTKQIYYEKYDAYFCPTCNQWLENTCPDPKCDFCTKRPSKPLKSDRI